MAIGQQTICQKKKIVVWKKNVMPNEISVLLQDDTDPASRWDEPHQLRNGGCGQQRSGQAGKKTLS